MIFAGGAVSPLLFAAVLAPLFLIALLSAYAPASRAALLDPAQVLREE
jgi:ABC-type lipoprotein release transport system permease subunit